MNGQTGGERSVGGGGGGGAPLDDVRRRELLVLAVEVRQGHPAPRQRRRPVLRRAQAHRRPHLPRRCGSRPAVSAAGGFMSAAGAIAGTPRLGTAAGGDRGADHLELGEDVTVVGRTEVAVAEPAPAG